MASTVVPLASASATFIHRYRLFGYIDTIEIDIQVTFWNGFSNTWLDRITTGSYGRWSSFGSVETASMESKTLSPPTTLRHQSTHRDRRRAYHIYIYISISIDIYRYRYSDRTIDG
jgi:hypothetical protein